MKLLTTIVLILFVISTFEMVFAAGQTAEDTMPAETLYLKPDYVPDIKPYIITHIHWSSVKTTIHP
jgi:hypothetical protein